MSNTTTIKTADGLEKLLRDYPKAVVRTVDRNQFNAFMSSAAWQVLVKPDNIQQKEGKFVVNMKAAVIQPVGDGGTIHIVTTGHHR